MNDFGFMTDKIKVIKITSALQRRRIIQKCVLIRSYCYITIKRNNHFYTTGLVRLVRDNLTIRNEKLIHFNAPLFFVQFPGKENKTDRQTQHPKGEVQ